MPVIDAHCHVACTDFVPPSFVATTIDNLVASLGDGSKRIRAAAAEWYAQLMDDPLCDRLVGEMDAAGIDAALLIVPDFTYALPDATKTIAELFEHAHGVVVRHPGRFTVLGGVDPRWGEDGLRLLERGLRDYGFAGTKIYPPCGIHPSDRMLYPAYELCRAESALVMVHIGGTAPCLRFEAARPIHVDTASADFPTLPFLLAHAGTTYPEESVMLATFRPNVFLDVSGYPAPYSAPLSRLTSAGVGHKLIFGSDWPLFGARTSLTNLIDTLRTDDGPLRHLRQHEQRLFFGGTISVLLSQALARRDNSQAR